MFTEHSIEKLDADYGIPRRANEDYLPSLQAFYCWLGAAFQCVLVLLAVTVASLLFIFAGAVLGFGVYGWAVIALVIFAACGISASFVWDLCNPYFEWHRLTTHGSARWATAHYLEGHGFARQAGDLPQKGEIQLGLLPRGFFKRAHRFIITAASVLGSFIFFGPPGMGKSVLLMSYLRLWGWFGNSCIVIDPKGELYKYAGRFFKNVFRVDFINPKNSDRWNFMPRCRGNREYASMIASVIMACAVKKNTSADGYWENAERSLLTALLLYISHKVDRPSPPMLAQFIQNRSLEQIGEELGKCDLEAVRNEWGNFNKAPENTRGSVFSGLATLLEPFTMDAAQAITAALTEEEKNLGVGEIDFSRLREPGTAVFLVIPEGMAKRYKLPLSTFFSEAVEALRQGEVDSKTTPVLLVVDEAAHVNFTELNEVAGVGRARLFALMLFYQNISQGYEQYGHDGFHAIIGSTNVKSILPGCDLPTTEFFSKMVSDMTIEVQTFDDAPGVSNDKTRHSPQSRALVFPSELRQMFKFKQAVTIVETMPPVKWRMPESVKDHIQLVPREYVQPKPLSLDRALQETSEREALEAKSTDKEAKHVEETAGKRPELAGVGKEPRQEPKLTADNRENGEVEHSGQRRHGRRNGDDDGVSSLSEEGVESKKVAESAARCEANGPVRASRSVSCGHTPYAAAVAAAEQSIVSDDSTPSTAVEEEMAYSVFVRQNCAIDAHVNLSISKAFDLVDNSFML